LCIKLFNYWDNSGIIFRLWRDRFLPNYLIFNNRQSFWNSSMCDLGCWQRRYINEISKIYINNTARNCPNTYMCVLKPHKDTLEQGCQTGLQAVCFPLKVMTLQAAIWCYEVPLLVPLFSCIKCLTNPANLNTRNTVCPCFFF